MRQVISIIVALGAFILHAATAWRYGYFRDELYFIACGHHLAWGYVDQPPLVALVAWMARPFGDALEALRFPVLIATALTVWAGCRIAHELGGGRFAQALAGMSIGLMPSYLALGNVLTTTSFEPLSWTLVMWCVIRIVRGENGARMWLLLAAAAVFGLYGKYSMALVLIAAAIGLLLTPQRRILRSRWFPVATALALAAIAPNLWWQAQHGWPFFAVLASDGTHRVAMNNGWQFESLNLATNAREFALEQVIYTSPSSMIVWIAGICAPFAWERVRDLRFVSYAFFILLIAAIALAAKGYYIIGIYAILMTIGAVVIERAAYLLRGFVLVAVTAAGLFFTPLSLPLLRVGALIAYTQALGLTGAHGTTPHLIQPLFAEEFGWQRLARDVSSVYDALPPATRAQTAVYADTYADAGAIDLFGARYGLPSAIGTQNSYYLWGTHGYDGKTMIAVGASRIALLRTYYHSCALARLSTEPLKWIVEGPSPIYLCTGPTMPLDRIWPHLRWYGA